MTDDLNNAFESIDSWGRQDSPASDSHNAYEIWSEHSYCPESLMTALNFTAEDLAANRAGRVTGSQKLTMHSGVSAKFFGTVLLVASGLWIIYMGLTVENSDAQVPLTTFGVILIAIGAVMVLMFFRIHYLIYSDSARNLTVTTGYAQLSKVTKEMFVGESTLADVDMCFLQIHGLKFPINSQAYAIFAENEGLLCRLYYLPRTGRIVSAEFLLDLNNSSP